MREKKEQIAALIFPSYFDFMDEPDTTEQDIADFARAIREYVNGNFEYISPNKSIRAELRQIRLEMKMRASRYSAKVETLRLNSAKGGETTKDRWAQFQDLKQANERQMRIDFAEEDEEIATEANKKLQSAEAQQVARPKGLANGLAFGLVTKNEGQNTSNQAAKNSNRLLLEANNKPPQPQPLLEANRLQGTQNEAKEAPETLQIAEAQQVARPKGLANGLVKSISISKSKCPLPSPNEGKEAQGFCFDFLRGIWNDSKGLAVPSGIASDQARLLRWRCTDPSARSFLLGEAGRLAAAGLSAEALGLKLGEILNACGKLASHHPMPFAAFKLCETLQQIEAKDPQLGPKVWAKFAEAFNKQAECAGMAEAEKILQRLLSKAQHAAKVGIGKDKPEQVHNLTAFLKA